MLIQRERVKYYLRKDVTLLRRKMNISILLLNLLGIKERKILSPILTNSQRSAGIPQIP